MTFILQLQTIRIALDNHSHMSKAAVDAGARSPREVLAKNGCDFNCGKCKCAMGEFIAAEMDKRIETIELVAAE